MATARPGTHKRWVWWSTPQSVKTHTVSVLALLEGVGAMAAYAWIAMRFDWPAAMFIGLFAAPMLLLRSPQSTRAGVAMLNHYVNGPAPSSGRMRVAAAVTAIATGVATLALLHLCGTGCGTPIPFWLLIVLMGAASLCGLACCIAYGGTESLQASIMPAMLVAAVATAAMQGAFAGRSPSPPMLVGLALGAAAVLAGVAWLVKTPDDEVPTVIAAPIYLLVVPTIGVGMWLRIVAIRITATLKYLRYGLASLPRNWFHTFAVLDLRHAPEVLPRGEVVSERFSVRGLWQLLNLKGGVKGDSLVIDKILPLTFLPIWLVPGLAYRWSLKATAWLWWPLALAARPPLVGLSAQASRERTAYTVNGILWRWLLPALALAVLLWLAASLTSAAADWYALLPDAVSKLLKVFTSHWTAPPPGIRFVSLAAACLLLLGVWYQSDRLNATHKKILEAPKELRDLGDGEDRARFLHLAQRLEKTRVLFVVALVFWCEAMVVHLARGAQPELVDRLVAPWLLHWI